jgi:hypothetical protein
MFANRVCKRTALTETNGHTGENVDYHRKNRESENGVLQGESYYIKLHKYAFYQLQTYIIALRNYFIVH